MKNSFSLWSIVMLMSAGSFLSAVPCAVSSDSFEERQKRVYDPPSKGSPKFRPSGTVIPPTLPPGGVFVPLPRSQERKYRRPPADAFAFSLSGVPFYYHSGTYYRWHRKEYVIVPVPIGARIRALPEGCSSLYTRGRSYYLCDDDCYVRDDDGYRVIERPVSIDREEIAEVDEEVRVLVDVLNVRSGPGTHFQIVTQLYRDDIVPVRGREPDWYFIDAPDETRGWIMGRYVKPFRGRYGGDR